MKVLFITRKFPPSTGGMENYAHDLYYSLQPKADTQLIKWGGSNKYLPIVIPIFFIKGFYRLARKQTDIIHIQDGVLAPLGLLLGRLFKKPFTVVVHGLDITYTNKIFQTINIRAIKKASIVFCISRAAADAAISKGIDPSKVKVIPIGMSDSLFINSKDEIHTELTNRFNLDAQTKILLTVGRLVRRKGNAWFIENVLPKIVAKNPKTVYLVAGQGEEHENIEQAVNKVGLENNVKLLGLVDDNLKQKLYNGADVFVMPNVTTRGDIEGFGLVLLEASLCQLPIVASNIEGIQDAVKNNYNGILVNEKDIPAFVEKINSFLNQKDYARKFGKEGRQYTLKNYEWSSIADQYIKEYDLIVKPKIALIGPLQPYRGGVAQYTTELHKALGQICDVSTFSFKRLYPKFLYPGASDQEPDGGEKLKDVNYTLDIYSPLSLHATANRIIASNCQVAIITWWTLVWQPGLALLARKLRKRGVKVIFLSHNLFDHDAKGIKRSISEHLVKQADGYIVHSNEEKALVAKLKPNVPVLQRILPIYEHYPPANQNLKKRGRLELLFYGFIRPYKGLDILIDAMEKLKDEEVYLTIVGETWKGSNELREQLLTRNIPNLELDLTYADQQKTADYFSRADIVVLPYISATGSAVLSVAYNYRKPVLATRVGGFIDGVIENKTGWLVKPADPAELASAIKKIERSQLPHMAKEIDTFCRANDWGHMAAAINDFVAEVLN